MDFHVKLERPKSFSVNIEKPKDFKVSLGKEILNKIDQKQVDLAQTDASQVDYIKNKSTKHLLNEGNDGTSPYVTEKDIKQITDSLEKLNQNKVENTTTINGYDLSGNIELRAEDINALPNTIKYAASLDLSIDSSTYVMTVQLKDQNGNFIGNSQSIDLPLESVVVNGFLDEEKDEVVLVLKNGNEIRFGITDITNGLVGKTELDKTNNKLSDLENKLANIEDKNREQDTTIANLNNDKADKSKIPTKVSQLENDEKFLKDYTETDPTVPEWAKAPTKPSYNYSEINNTPIIPTVNNPTIIIKQGEETKGTFTLNQSNDSTIELDVGGGCSGSNVTLYETTGQNTDGAMTQKATTDELNKKVEFEDFDEIEFTPGMQSQLNNMQSQLSGTQNEVNNMLSQLSSTQNEVNNKADKSQWVNVEKLITGQSNMTVDLSSILPDNTSNYEILFHTYSWGSTGTWVASVVKVNTPALTNDISIAGSRTYANSTEAFVVGSTIIPVLGSNRSITIKPEYIGNGGYRILGYRRISK